MPVKCLLLRLVFVAGLLLFWGLALHTAVQKSPTNDEPVHFTRGVVLGQNGDLRLQFEHAPLSHRLIGLFLQSEAEMPRVVDLTSWTHGDRLQIAQELVWQMGLDVERVFMLARLPIIWLGLILGALVVSWAWVWNGRHAAIIALILFSFSPNLLAHAALATTDLATATFYFGTVYVWWLYWQKHTVWRWAAAAVFLGLALATKLTAVLLLPILFVLAYVGWRRQSSFWEPALHWLGLLLPAAFVLWGVYGFESAPMFGISLPAATYWQSWQSVLSHVDSGHPAFFMGEVSSTGWWHYFGATFWLKTPILTQVLVLLGLIIVVLRRNLWRTAVFLVLPVVTLFGVTTLSRLNIGYRHILPILPFLLVLASVVVLPLKGGNARAGRSRSGRLSPRIQKLFTILLGFSLAVYGLNTLRQQPHHLAYFNPLVGGLAQGYKYLGDSNLDWGQDLPLLAETISLDEKETWRISYAGVGDPSYYGIAAKQLITADTLDSSFAPANPAAGRYAISANHLQGILADADLFDWFRRTMPEGNLGGSILIFDVHKQAAGKWIAHCLDPVPLLTPAAAELWLGQVGLRHLWFDCSQTWVFPEDGAPGWLILPQSESWWVQDQLSQGMAERLQLVYRHAPSDLGPSFDVYYWAGGVVEMADGDDMVELEDGTAVTLPHTLANTIQLHSYTSVGDTWYTLWRVNTTTNDPLSLQAHLYTGESLPLVADSLGFSSDQWQPGDWLIQRHHFPDQPQALFMETGLTNYQTQAKIDARLRLHMGYSE